LKSKNNMKKSDLEIIKDVEAQNSNKPHPKDNEELQKILSEIEEIGGAKQGTIEHGDWSLNGKAVDF